MTIIAVIPTYNDEVYLRDVIRNTRLYVDDIIVVDDASEDATSFIAFNMNAKLIRHEKFMGRAAALKTGFKAAMKLNPTVIVTIYANGFHNPDDIPTLLGPIFWSHADAVAGENKIISCNNFAKKENTAVSLTNASQKTVNETQMLSGSIINENIDILNDRYKGFAAFSSKVLNVLNFSHDNLPIEKSLIKNVIDSGFIVNSVQVSGFVYSERSELYKYKIGVVIPAYNEELLIKVTVEGVPPYISRIYVINDASTDSTAQILASIDDPRLYIITHQLNQGVGAAILHGYKRALKENMDITVVMGGDNQMNPDQLPKLIMPIIKGRADYTKGNRLFSKEFRGGMSRWRLFGNSMLTFINKIASGYWHIMDPQNGYTAISRKALAGMELDTLFTYYGYCNDILVKLNTFGFRTMDIIMPARYGEEKSSIKYGKFIFRVSFMLFKKFLWRLKMKYTILNFHPLVLFYALGLIMVPIGMLFTFYLLISKLLLGWIISPSYLVLDVFLLMTGIQFILFAMLFDMQESDKYMRESNQLSLNNST